MHTCGYLQDIVINVSLSSICNTTCFITKMIASSLGSIKMSILIDPYNYTICILKYVKYVFMTDDLCGKCNNMFAT